MSNHLQEKYEFYVPSMRDDTNLRSLQPGRIELTAPTLENDDSVIKIEGIADKNHMTTIIVDVAGTEYGSAITISRKDGQRLQVHDFSKIDNNRLFAESSDVRNLTINMIIPQCWETGTDYHELADKDDAYALPRFLGVVGLCANAMQLGMKPHELMTQQQALSVMNSQHCDLHLH